MSNFPFEPISLTIMSLPVRSTDYSDAATLLNCMAYGWLRYFYKAYNGNSNYQRRLRNNLSMESFVESFHVTVKIFTYGMTGVVLSRFSPRYVWMFFWMVFLANIRMAGRMGNALYRRYYQLEDAEADV